MRAWVLVVVLLLSVSVASASLIAVANTDDTGRGSLRWSIWRANTLTGPDDIIFDSVLAGSVIRPLSQLPNISDDQTTINGDVDDDGKPDITISGRKAGSAHGLVVAADQCAIQGLTLTAFSGNSIVLFGANNCQVVGCYLGVTPALPLRRAIGHGGIRLWDSHHNTIGGTTAKERNIIASGRDGAHPAVRLRKSSNNAIIGNYFGLAPNGSKLIGLGWDGVSITDASGPADSNRIGGTAPGSGNVFAGLQAAVTLHGATNTQILGNLFGLRADGDTIGRLSSCVNLRGGTTNTQIGGTTAAARNVFAGVYQWYAIDIADPGTVDNSIQGNYFGTNQAGTEQRRLHGGIIIWRDAGAQVIGGPTPEAGNRFAAYNPVSGPGNGIRIAGPGAANIRNNVFGILPNGTASTGMGTAIGVYKGNAWVVDNAITHASTSGLRVWGDGAHVSAFRNIFRHCREAVYASHDVTCRLGNLGNASTGDDGGNEFKPSNTWFIWNTTTKVLKAEGNDFDTTSMSAIDAKIFDKLDCPGAGRVDFIPLKNGVIPTGATSPASLALTNAAAVATGTGGAEIIFRLSAPADVTVTILNIAGRPVANVARDLPTEAGTRHVLWSGKTDRDTRVPGGTYLVQVTARGPEGRLAQTLCTLPIQRQGH